MTWRTCLLDINNPEVADSNRVLPTKYNQPLFWAFLFCKGFVEVNLNQRPMAAFWSPGNSTQLNKHFNPKLNDRQLQTS